MGNKFKSSYKKLIGLRNQAAEELYKKHADSLNYISKKKLLLPGLIKGSKQLMAGASLATSLFFNPVKIGEVPKLLDRPPEERIKSGLVSAEEVKQLIKEKISPYLPKDIGKLQPEQEKKICQILEDTLGIKVSFELEENELNFHYGWTGYEQHLYRYPGDSLQDHDEELEAGIAPGLGAWGYFADSKEAMSKEDYLREKYYIAVQTLYLPEWQTRSEELYEWYKYRKMVMINPENGHACIVVVGDAGPAKWTGKQFGGSPEVMKVLDLHEGYRKGKVLVLFVDDKEDKVPLGPIDFNLKEGRPIRV